MHAKFKISLLIASLVLGISACSTFQQASEAVNFVNCDFRLESVSNLKIAGVSIQNKRSLADLSFADAAKITGTLAGGTLPMTFDLNVQARNPNATSAGMNKLDWILLIDKQEMISGVLTDRIQIASNAMTSFPVKMNLDLMKALSGKSADAILNLAFSLAGTGATSKITLKAKPTIMVGNSLLQYPGYISITKEFGGK